MGKWSEETKQHCKQVLLQKYGVTNVAQLLHVRRKRRNTLLKRYGTLDSARVNLSNKEIQRRKNRTCLKKYGVACITQTRQFVDIAKTNRKITFLRKYGVDNPLKIPSIVEKMSSRMKVLRADPLSAYNSEEFLKKIPKVIAAMHQGLKKNKRPTRLERKVIDLASQNNWPLKYTGDGKFSLRIGLKWKFPDFIVLPFDKTKGIIEVFGTPWHTKEEEQTLPAFYKSAGYKCLIIWQQEFQNLLKVQEKIGLFLTLLNP